MTASQSVYGDNDNDTPHHGGKTPGFVDGQTRDARARIRAGIREAIARRRQPLLGLRGCRVCDVPAARGPGSRQGHGAARLPVGGNPR